MPGHGEQRDAVANAYSELIASDVVYAASFQRPAQQVLERRERHRRRRSRLHLGASRPSSRTRTPNGNGLWIQSVRDAGNVQARAPTARSARRSSRHGERQDARRRARTVTTVKLKIPLSFVVTVKNGGNCIVRGISVHLTEGNEKTLVHLVKSLLPNEIDTETFAAVGNPGEVQDRRHRLARRRRVEQGDNNHYTYHVAFQS